MFDTAATVPFRGEDATVVPDVAQPDVGGVDTGNEMDLGGPDAAGLPLYDRDSLPRGTTCEAVPTAAPAYVCNPVLQDCGGGQICEILILAEGFSTTCRLPNPGETFLRPDASSCDVSSTTERCRLGATCLGGQCRALCEFDGAVGCPTAQFCDTIADGPGPAGDELEGYGACLQSCR